MKTEPGKNRTNLLLDAVLREESWSEFSAAVKSAAMAEFYARQRRRRLVFGLAQTAAVLVVAASIGWSLYRPATTETRPAVASANTHAPFVARAPSAAAIAEPVTATVTSGMPALPAHLSVAQMLALFPKGSCEVVVIDGVKQLIFYDQKVEREGALYQPGG